MITKINIRKFDLYFDHKRIQNIGNDSGSVFKKINIIHGRNHTGKTTLSRMIRYIEKGKLHEKHTDGGSSSTKLTFPKKQINHFIVQKEQNCFEVTPLSRTEDVKIESNHTHFYNLANNTRKFLECYLSYRLPNNKERLKNLDLLFNNNIPALVDRVINEGSRLTWGDRGTLPQDVVEAESLVL